MNKKEKFILFITLNKIYTYIFIIRAKIIHTNLFLKKNNNNDFDI